MNIKFFLKKKYLQIKYFKKNVKFRKNVLLSLNCNFEGCNRIGNDTAFFGNMGFASYIGDHCAIYANIGRFSCIAPRVVTVCGSHPTRDWVSVHPAFFSTKRQCGLTFVNENKYDELKPAVNIGNDVWIGDSAIIYDGITIGDGAVVAAGAVVTKDVEPYSIVGGVPARVLRYRFEQDEIEKLLKIKWWNKGTAWLKDNADRFENIKVFLNAEDD
ncbi:MAG: CatB-related O-acetyltransferase [Monoglobales bacterium]